MYKDTIIAILYHTLTYNKTESSFQIDVADSTISFEEALDIFFPGWGIQPANEDATPVHFLYTIPGILYTLKK